MHGKHSFKPIKIGDEDLAVLCSLGSHREVQFASLFCLKVATGQTCIANNESSGRPIAVRSLALDLPCGPHCIPGSVVIHDGTHMQPGHPANGCCSQLCCYRSPQLKHAEDSLRYQSVFVGLTLSILNCVIRYRRSVYHGRLGLDLPTMGLVAGGLPPRPRLARRVN